MKPHSLLAAVTLLLSSAFAPAVAHAQFTGDRGRPVDQMPLVMRSLVIDVLSKGLKSGSRPLLRRVLADPVLLNGVATDREVAIDAINARIDAIRQNDRRLVLSQSPADSIGHSVDDQTHYRDPVCTHALPPCRQPLNPTGSGSKIAAALPVFNPISKYSRPLSLFLLTPGPGGAMVSLGSQKCRHNPGAGESGHESSPGGRSQQESGRADRAVGRVGGSAGCGQPDLLREIILIRQNADAEPL